MAHIFIPVGQMAVLRVADIADLVDAVSGYEDGIWQPMAGPIELDPKHAAGMRWQVVLFRDSREVWAVAPPKDGAPSDDEMGERKGHGRF